MTGSSAKKRKLSDCQLGMRRNGKRKNKIWDYSIKKIRPYISAFYGWCGDVRMSIDGFFPSIPIYCLVEEKKRSEELKRNKNTNCLIKMQQIMAEENVLEEAS
jgi:hypothetical protein